MTNDKKPPAKKAVRARKAPAPQKASAKAADAPDVMVDPLDALTERLERLEKLQEDQFLLAMKFSVVRSIHIITMMLEQSSAPPRYIAQAVEMANEATQKIVRAKELDEVRKLDIELQNQLRNVIGAFSKQ